MISPECVQAWLPCERCNSWTLNAYVSVRPIAQSNFTDSSGPRPSMDGLLVLFHFRALTTCRFELILPVVGVYPRLLVQNVKLCRNFTQTNRTTRIAFLCFIVMQCCYLSTAKEVGATDSYVCAESQCCLVYTNTNIRCNPVAFVDERIHKKKDWKGVCNLWST